MTLEVGGIEETTTVVAEAPLLRTDSSEVGTVIEERAIKELPLNGRNFATLVYLTPGITPGQAGENLSGASTFNPRGASNFNALGHQANANGWLIDGIYPTIAALGTFGAMLGGSLRAAQAARRRLAAELDSERDRLILPTARHAASRSSGIEPPTGASAPWRLPVSQLRPRCTRALPRWKRLLAESHRVGP